MSVEIDNLVTPEDVAPLFSKTPRTIQLWAKAGKIPCYRIGGRYLFNLAEIKRWIKDHYHEPE